MIKPLVQQCLSVPSKDETRPALSWNTQVLTRSELRKRVAMRIEVLRKLGVSPGQRVLICLPKSPAAVELLLACLAIGAVAVPVDARTPLIRLNRIVAEISPSVFASHPSLSASVDILSCCQILAVTEVEQLGDPGKLDTPYPASEDDLAMILMSSGSTGRPKGICLTHGNLRTFVEWAVATFGLTHEDRFLSVAPLHFDLSIFDIFVSQYVGATVHLLSETQTAFPAEILEALGRHRITVFYTVPTILQMMFTRTGRTLSDLRWLLFAGEVMPRSTLPALYKAAPNARLANLYGPTETNVVTCHFVCPEDCQPASSPLPIGSACSHSQIWVCDHLGHPVSDGVEGEICVQGPTVTPGYWGRAELSLASRIQGRTDTYRTGDFGWLEADGTLHFAGRRDHRVKVRGNYVDLAEIEHTAMSSGKLNGAIAVVQNQNTPRATIELFATPQPGQEIEITTLFRFLSDRLVKHSVPSRILKSGPFSQTLNGKTDRQSLVRLQNDNPTSERNQSE